MTELEALRRVAEAAQILAESCGVIRGKTPEDDDIWTVEIDHVRELNAALRALPAPAEPEGEVVEVAVWRDNDDGEVVFCTPKTKQDGPLQGWTRLGTTRLALVPEVVGEVG